MCLISMWATRSLSQKGGLRRLIISFRSVVVAISQWAINIPQMNGARPFRSVTGSNFVPLAAVVFSQAQVEQMAKGTRSNRKAARKGTRKGKRGGTPWTKFVKKIYNEMKAKNPNTKLGDAMKAASKRKSEM